MAPATAALCACPDVIHGEAILKINRLEARSGARTGWGGTPERRGKGVFGSPILTDPALFWAQPPDKATSPHTFCGIATRRCRRKSVVFGFFRRGRAPVHSPFASCSIVDADILIEEATG